MKRYNFVFAVAICGLIIAGLFWARARRPHTSTRVGIFLYARQPIIEEIYKGFRDELDKQASAASVELEYIVQSADGDAAQATAIGSYFRTSNVDAICVIGLPAAQALKSAGVKQPVIFAGPPDPVGAGLVPSLKAHGTNFTGTRYLPPAGVILTLFKGAFPNAHRVAILHNPGEANSMVVVRGLLSAAKEQGLQVRDLGASNATEVEAALRALVMENADGLFLPTDNLVYSSLDRILAEAKQARIPVFNCTKLSVEKGAVFSLATDYTDIGKLTAAAVAAPIILGNKQPQEIDVVDVVQGYLYVNSSTETANRIGAPPAGYKIIRVP